MLASRFLVGCAGALPFCAAGDDDDDDDNNGGGRVGVDSMIEWLHRMTLEMKEWLWEMMDPDLLAADDELVEVWDRINHGEVARQSETIGEEEEV